MTEEEYNREYKKVRPFIGDCWGNTINGDLEKGYKSLTLPMFQSSDIEQKISCPLFINLGQPYEAGKGIFIIGQETHGWGGNSKNIGNSLFSFKNAKCEQGDSKEKILMEVQSEWLLMHYQYYIDSDFHNAVKTITGIVKGEDFPNSQFVWDDLIAMDYGGGSYRNLKVADRKKVLKYSSDKLEMELKIAKPKIAIFLIGSYGDSEFWKMNVFKDLKKDDFHEKIPNLNMFDLKLKDNCNQEFIIKCYATSHPSYKGWVNKEDVMRKLTKVVEEQKLKQRP